MANIDDLAHELRTAMEQAEYWPGLAPAILRDKTVDWYPRAMAAETLKVIAQHYPETCHVKALAESPHRTFRINGR